MTGEACEKLNFCLDFMYGLNDKRINTEGQRVMKRIILSVLAVVCSTALVEAQQVLSRNAVGYVQVDVLSNNVVLASLPFNSLSGGDYTIAEIMGNQLVGGATFGTSDNVIKWDPVSQTYLFFWKNLGGEWRQFPQGFQTTNTLIPGEGFFILNKRATNQTVFLMGEVPDSLTLPSAAVNVIEGVQLISYSYPAEIGINDTTLIDDAKRGATFGVSDNLVTWDPVTKAYSFYWLPLGTNTWRKFPLGVPTTDIIKPGEAVFYIRKDASPFVWTESKPYTWPE